MGCISNLWRMMAEVGIYSLQPEVVSRGARMLRTALGPAIGGWLEDPSVIVMLNPDGRLEQLIQEAVVTVPRTLIAETISVIAVLAGRGA